MGQPECPRVFPCLHPDTTYRRVRAVLVYLEEPRAAERKKEPGLRLQPAGQKATVDVVVAATPFEQFNLSNVAATKMANVFSNPFVRFVRQLVCVHLAGCGKNRSGIIVNDSERDPVWFLRIELHAAVWGDFSRELFNPLSLPAKSLFVSFVPSSSSSRAVRHASSALWILPSLRLSALKLSSSSPSAVNRDATTEPRVGAGHTCSPRGEGPACPPAR